MSTLTFSTSWSRYLALGSPSSRSRTVNFSLSSTVWNRKISGYQNRGRKFVGLLNDKILVRENVKVDKFIHVLSIWIGKKGIRGKWIGHYAEEMIGEYFRKIVEIGILTRKSWYLQRRSWRRYISFNVIRMFISFGSDKYCSICQKKKELFLQTLAIKIRNYSNWEIFDLQINIKSESCL